MSARTPSSIPGVRTAPTSMSQRPRSSTWSLMRPPHRRSGAPAPHPPSRRQSDSPSMSDASSISWLFVPADRPDRFEKAAASGADETILDLEDAVAPAEKPIARRHAAAWLSSGGRGWVRINAHGTPWHEDDLDALIGRPGLRGLVVPK